MSTEPTGQDCTPEPVGPDPQEVALITDCVRDAAAASASEPTGAAAELDLDVTAAAAAAAAAAADISNTTATTAEDEDDTEGSYYWDATTMAPLNATSAAAVQRLRSFRPPEFPLWDQLPLSRRAAVLVLLYADRKGDLRVVITMRAASLRSYSGHAAFPGGKADSLEETPYQIARREAWEEIGLPIDDAKLPKPFRIEHLCYLPFNLAKTELVVRPCVAFLHSSPDPSGPTVEEALMPRLDAKEVAAVFSAPFHNFLLATDEVLPAGGGGGGGGDSESPQESPPPLPKGEWYKGSWMNWHEEPWRLHYFFVPVHNQRVTKPRVREGGLAAIAEHLEEEQEDAGRYMVWGMTARMLVDAARLAYGREPEFEHNSHLGDERMIEGLHRMGRLGEKKKAGSELTQADLKEAASKM
ncbi:uncharacterized protein E0L32_011645 [Thyridium curvatum]|uniref:Nudix hydrolase domain-containing protein n=1 Tax=Thyridium curvatum TaxID=1093900 RepID=A0A507BNX5_9PEZI|nr:uncharacterized protein E0L32_011645 [Thyridium curvatum]TPX18460.1 hypothetical protein E0L32_011645 [Thyridium curvatum]